MDRTLMVLLLKTLEGIGVVHLRQALTLGEFALVQESVAQGSDGQQQHAGDYAHQNQAAISLKAQ